MAVGKRYTTEMVRIIKNLFFIQIALSISVSACNLFDNAKENVMITVGKRKITEDELKRDVKRLTFEMGITDQDAKNGMQALISKVVDDYLIMEYGNEQGITISEQELEATINEIKKDYPEEVFQTMLLQRYVDFEEWKRWLKQELLIKKIVQRALADIPPVTFQETKAYYESHREEFKRPRMVELTQIVVKTRDKAKKILKLLVEGEDMSELAKAHSITPEAENGGYLGWIAKDDLEDTMDKVIFSLPIGQISTIVQTTYGYHIFKVQSKRPEGYNSLPESMKQIEAKLLLEKKDSFYREWLNNLRVAFPIVFKKEITNDWRLDE